MALLSGRSCCPNLAAVDAETTDGSRGALLLELTLLLLQLMLVLASRLHHVLASGAHYTADSSGNSFVLHAISLDDVMQT